MGIAGAQSVKVGDVEMRVSIRGSGPPVLMMNGLGGSLGVLEPLQDALPDFRTIVFDPLGVGKSTPLKRPMRLRSHADHVAKLLDTLELDRIDLFGVSWGGALAQEFAYRHGDRVRRLVLTSTTPGPGFLTTPEVYFAFFDIRPRDAQTYKDHVAPVLFGGKARHDAEGLFGTGVFRHLTRKNTSAYYFQMASAIGWSSLRYLATLRQPTLLLTGDDDPLIRPYNARLIDRLLPNSELRFIEGEGHFMIVSSAGELAGYIREFLNRGADERQRAT